MTTKDLSRKLCDICGIKPMYRLKDINVLYNEDMYNEFCEMRLNKGLLIPTGTKAVFPDFTQPENFVKLIELRFTTKRGDIFTVVEALQNGRCFTFADRKSFFDQLLDYIFTCENFGEYIKQAIRETEWVYE